MADTRQVLNLAAIICKVDGNHSKGAAALAESILDHPNFRALCAELHAALDRHDLTLAEDQLLDRSAAALRAALADEPAVPEGREPASVTGQPSDDELLRLYGVATPCHTVHEWERELNFARAVLTRWGNPAPTLPADVSQLSDGYHTFAELYEHRHSLMLALMRAQPHICWFSRRHADGELPFGSDGWFIVGAELPDAPITYHLPASLYSLAQKTGAIELPAGRPWDGHTAADVVRRLRVWAITPPPPADGELVEWPMVTAGGEGSFGRVRRTRAAELLQHLSPPQPVPVSERLPGPKDCDAKGMCWWLHVGRDGVGDWFQRAPYPSVTSYAFFCITHWLPAHALPLPGQEVEG